MEQPAAGALVFVHGGAWRSEDKADHASLARRLAETTKSPVLVPNYRLTATKRTEHMFRHPGHAQDILDFLRFLETWALPSQPKGTAAPVRSLILIGHSCSAHMLASIFLDSDHVTPSLCPPPQLLKAVKGIVMSEGIYDIGLLLKTFPKYADWFIEDAFGVRDDDYAPFDVSKYASRTTTGRDPISWLVLHSKADTLIDIPQSQKMYDRLIELNRGQTEGRILHDFGSLKDEHDDILRGDEYVALIKEFVGHVHGCTTPQDAASLP